MLISWLPFDAGCLCHFSHVWELQRKVSCTSERYNLIMEIQSFAGSSSLLASCVTDSWENPGLDPLLRSSHFTLCDPHYSVWPSLLVVQRWRQFFLLHCCWTLKLVQSRMNSVLFELNMLNVWWYWSTSEIFFSPWGIRDAQGYSSFMMFILSLKGKHFPWLCLL